MALAITDEHKVHPDSQSMLSSRWPCQVCTSIQATTSAVNADLVQKQPANPCSAQTFEPPCTHCLLLFRVCTRPHYSYLLLLHRDGACCCFPRMLHKLSMVDAVTESDSHQSVISKCTTLSLTPSISWFVACRWWPCGVVAVLHTLGCI